MTPAKRTSVTRQFLEQATVFTDAPQTAGDAAAAGLRNEYLTLCTTLGRQVRVLLPADRVLAGRAIDVDAAGRLLVEPAPGSDTSGLAGAERGGGGLVAVSAGDVIHVR